jgi:hypothetical protein
MNEKMTRKRIVAVAASLACLFFLTSFRNLLYPTGGRFYEYEVPRVEFVAVLISVVIATVVIAALLFLIDAVREPRVRIELQLAFLALGVVCFSSLNAQTEMWLFPGTENALNFELPLLVLLIVLLFSLRPSFSVERIFGNFQKVVLVLLPFGIFLCVQAAFSAVTLDRSLLAPHEIESQPGKPAPHRVVWIVFDELEAGTLRARPADVELPAIDGLMRESFVAENAYPPNQWTKESIHSLLTGRIVTNAESVSARNLRYTFADASEQRAMSETENIFSDVASAGGRSGAVGWFIPYPRAFSSQLSYGQWRPLHIAPCRSLGECTELIWGEAVASLPVANPFGSRPAGHSRELDPRRALSDQVERVEFLNEKTRELAIRRDIAVSFFHLPVTHAPFITEHPEPTVKGYLQSLKLADALVAQVREDLEREGLWGNTTLIISGDHWWRFKKETDFAFLTPAERQSVLADRRVPFIVKLPGTESGLRYERRLNTVLTRYLVNQLIAGRLRTPGEVAAWFDTAAVERPALAGWMPAEEKIGGDTIRRNRSEEFVAVTASRPATGEH